MSFDSTAEKRKKELITAFQLACQVGFLERPRNDHSHGYRKGTTLSGACPSDCPSTTSSFLWPEMGNPVGGEERAMPSHVGQGLRVPSTTKRHFIRMLWVRADPPALFKKQPQR